jgi:hypothetical protein
MLNISQISCSLEIECLPTLLEPETQRNRLWVICGSEDSDSNGYRPKGNFGSDDPTRVPIFPIVANLAPRSKSN